MNKKIDLQITGMHCQSCEILIKEELSELPGVSEINVDHKTGMAHLFLDEAQSSPDALLTAISKAGYTATIESKDASGKKKAFKEIIVTKEKPNGSIFNPIKIVYSSRFAAEGNIIGNERGVLQIEGSLNREQNTEFIIPDGK